MKKKNPDEILGVYHKVCYDNTTFFAKDIDTLFCTLFLCSGSSSERYTKIDLHRYNIRHKKMKLYATANYNHPWARNPLHRHTMLTPIFVYNSSSLKDENYIKNIKEIVVTEAYFKNKYLDITIKGETYDGKY